MKFSTGLKEGKRKQSISFTFESFYILVCHFVRRVALFFHGVGVKEAKKEVEAFPLLRPVLISSVCYFVHNARPKYNSHTRFGRVYQAEIFNGFKGS